MSSAETLTAALSSAFPAPALVHAPGGSLRGQISLELPAAQWLGAAQQLRDAPALRFEQLIDLCGVDYLAYEGQQRPERRFAVAVHLLSVTLNQRLRVKIFCEDDAWPRMASVVSVWPSADWFEREAFDLMGIAFDGHPDLRRILTDYNFNGHPLRKDFPVSGEAELRYDLEQERVTYQSVSIEPRIVTPRIRREDGYGH